MINGYCHLRNAEKIPHGIEVYCILFPVQNSEVVLHPEKIRFTWCSYSDVKYVSFCWPVTLTESIQFMHKMNSISVPFCNRYKF